MVDFGDIGSTIARAIGSSGKASKDSSDDVTLSVNGQRFEGWKQISVQRSIKTVSNGFEVGLVEKWAHNQEPWRIVPQAECILTIGSETIITGFVDDVEPSFSNSGRSIRVTGRDKACDLVDCSAVHKPGNWTDISLYRLAQILCKPFGIKVTQDATSGTLVPFKNWRMQDSETPFESLDRAAKQCGVLLVNDGEGGIVITRASTTRAGTDLVEGVNILSGRANYTSKERFSKYVVKTQNGGFDEEVPGVDFSITASATDEGVKRYRPLTILAEGAATIEICRTRARWEASVRAAKSSRFEVMVQGWRRANGVLWAPNELTTLDSPSLGVKQDFLIVAVTFEKSSGGTYTRIQLERPDAYVPDPTVKARKDPWGQLVLEDRRRR